MTSQILFGESFSILEEEQDWFHVCMHHDDFQGWVDKESVQELETSGEILKATPAKTLVVTFPSIALMDLTAGRQLILPAGSSWPSDGTSNLELLGRKYQLLSLEGVEKAGKELDLAEIGKGLVSLPAMFGGRCGFGFDAPGLVQMLYKMKGGQLPRTSQEQSARGTAINFLHEVRTGDLAFFDNPEGEIDHVGLLLGGGEILHAHQQVRMDRFDQQGIYNAEKNRYTHKLRIIKRIED